MAETAPYASDAVTSKFHQEAPPRVYSRPDVSGPTDQPASGGLPTFTAQPTSGYPFGQLTSSDYQARSYAQPAPLLNATPMTSTTAVMGSSTVQQPSGQPYPEQRVERIIEERLKQVPRVEYCERLVEVPKIVAREKVVQVPNIEYRTVTVDKMIDVPEIREQVITKEVRVPQYVEVNPPAEKVFVDVDRFIPVPVEAITTYEYRLAQFRPRTTKVKYPMYVPRFIEVPVSAEKVESSQLTAMQELASKVSFLTAPQAMGLREIEAMATEIRDLNFASLATPTPEMKEEERRVLREKWQTGQLPIAVPQLQESMEQTA